MSLADLHLAGPSLRAGRRPGAILLPMEAVLIALMTGTLLLLAILSLAFARPVDWDGVLRAVAPGVALMWAGVLARARGTMPRFALFAIGGGFFSNFGFLTALVLSMRFPIAGGTFDAWLIAADAVTGYQWPDGVALLAAMPEASAILARVYTTVFLQLLAVMALLAWLDRPEVVHRFVLTGILALILTGAIWWVAPTLGPSAMFPIDPGMAEAASLVVDGAYGAELRRLAQEGSVVVSPNGVLGVISFPSYHMVMALLTAWFARGTWAAVPAAILGLAMVPATLVHGGHYAVDLVGGGLAFAAALALATRLIPPRA